ncbi:hypothetical protein [Pontibacter chitinilyticus]|uniref:hypothetical protein n=1 Tax=Pontibacter chitinilyticus TaxID=2674989 RepID=UPI00321AC163
MKLLKYFAVVVLLLACQAAEAQTSNLDVFAGKLKKYAATHQANGKWTMPVLKSTAGQALMPSPKLIGYMEDSDTGLRYYPKLGKICDPETSYTYDLRTKKIYKGKEEIKIKML